MNQISSGGDDDRRIAQQLLGFYGGPAFARRARAIEEAERSLAERLRTRRDELLAMVRLRIGQLRALCGDWDRLLPLVDKADMLDSLRLLHDELQPQLRLPPEPTRSLRTLRSAMNELVEAIESFNQKWAAHIAKFELGALNLQRENYNKHYLIEKECALGNSTVARMGFKRLEPLTHAELLEQFPLLTMGQRDRPGRGRLHQSQRPDDDR